MKTISYAIAAAGAVSVAEASSQVEWTKKELEDSTHAFFEQHGDRIKSVGNQNLRKIKPSQSATWQRELRGGKGKKNSGWGSGSSGGSHSEDKDWSGSGSGSGDGDEGSWLVSVSFCDSACIRARTPPAMRRFATAMHGVR